MDRKDFLAAIGLSTVTFAAINCIGCSKSGDASASGVSGPTGVDFTLDLSTTANAVLLTNGGYLASNGVIVARTSYPLIYQGSSQRFYCNNHGSYFNEAGVVQVSPAAKSLTTYTTVLTGTSLRVHS